MNVWIGRIPVALVLVIAAGAAACGPGELPEEERHDPGAVADATDEAGLPDRARRASGALMTELKRRLGAELSSGGAVSAVNVCSEVAQEIAASHSVEGVRVRRISLRARNLADVPDAYERGRLEELAGLHEAGELPEETWEIVETAEGRVFRYMKPILVGEVCLRCHGDPAGIDPEALQVIRERYPDDRAVGYSVGDLRGAVSVTIPLDTGS